MKPALLVLLATLLVGCNERSETPSRTTGTNPATTNKSFEVRGVIREIPVGGQTLVVRHEEIPGYMPKMTMELNVRATNEIRNLHVNDTIRFRLVATEDTHWIEHIVRLGGDIATNTPPVAARPAEAEAPQLVRELKPGDDFPDAELLDEHARTLRFSQLRGQAVAFALFFTRCPLPDYCPLMNKNFSRARSLLQTNSAGATNWTFLSVSFDAEFDSPLMLSSYAPAYRGTDARHWLFASASSGTLRTLAPQIDFMFQRDDGGFSHNLRTVVIDAQGRIQRVLNGNKWQPAELADEMLKAMQAKP